MKIRLMIIVAAIATLFSSCATPSQSKEEIRKEALVEWQEMKFGLFIHWGIYSVPAGVWKGKQIELLGEQIQRHAYIPHDEYSALAEQFNPTLFDADAIVKLAKNAGMKYVVLTTKHHDGFCMFDSKYTDFDIMDASPYKKDILKALAEACKREGLKLGLYYSTPDWHFNYPNVEVNPDDNKISVFSKVTKEAEDYQVNQLRELLSNYGDIVELFFDMGEPTAAQSKRFAETIHELQPKCVVNGRIMNNEGDFITMPDNHLPDMPVKSLAWEMPGTFYHTWGYKSWVVGDPLPQQIKKQVQTLSKIAARGGNFLLNIGPKSDGSVLEYERKVLEGVGEWMKVNSEAIHGTGTTPFTRLDWGECTTGDQRLYLHIFDFPKDGKLLIPGLRSNVTKVYPLANPTTEVKFEQSVDGCILDLSSVEECKNTTVVAVDYSGDLDIKQPIISESNNGTFVLKGGDAIQHGKYGRESYRSILKDYYRTWSIDVAEAGLYEVEISYNLRYSDKLFKVSAENGGEISFELTSDGNAKAKVELIDGNEEDAVSKPAKRDGKFYTTNVGRVELKKVGRTEITFAQGKEFELKATTAEFKAQDHKYRAMNIGIKDITLRRVK